MQNFRLEPTETWSHRPIASAEIIGGRLVEVRLGGDRGALLAERAACDWRVARRRSSTQGALADQPAVQPAGRRLEDHAEPRRAVDDQPDVDGIIVAAADELLGPVERIDQEIGVAMRRDPPGGDLLLGDHRNAGRGPPAARRG